MKRSCSPLSFTTLIADAFFMKNLDGTIIARALPQMAKSFHVGAVSLNIGMTAYLLTLAVLVLICGWVADRYGSRNLRCRHCHVHTFVVAMRRGAHSHAIHADADCAGCGRRHDSTGGRLIRVAQQA